MTVVTQVKAVPVVLSVFMMHSLIMEHGMVIGVLVLAMRLPKAKIKILTDGLTLTAHGGQTLLMV